MTLELEMKIGNTKITFDTSYVDSLTEEEKRINYIRYCETCWALFDDVLMKDYAIE